MTGRQSQRRSFLWWTMLWLAWPAASSSPPTPQEATTDPPDGEIRLGAGLSQVNATHAAVTLTNPTADKIYIPHYKPRQGLTLTIDEAFAVTKAAPDGTPQGLLALDLGSDFQTSSGRNLMASDELAAWGNRTFVVNLSFDFQVPLLAYYNVSFALDVQGQAFLPDPHSKSNNYSGSSSSSSSNSNNINSNNNLDSVQQLTRPALKANAGPVAMNLGPA